MKAEDKRLIHWDRPQRHLASTYSFLQLIRRTVRNIRSLSSFTDGEGKETVASGVPSLVENLKKVPVWAFHGADDSTVLAYEGYGSVPMVEMIHAANPAIPAKITVYPETVHNSWTKTYRGTGMFNGDFRLDQYI